MFSKIIVISLLHTIILLVVLNICCSDKNLRSDEYPLDRPVYRKLSEYNSVLPLSNRKCRLIGKHSKHESVHQRRNRHQYKQKRSDVGVPVYLGVNHELQTESHESILEEMVKNSVQERTILEPPSADVNSSEELAEKVNRRNTNAARFDSSNVNNTLSSNGTVNVLDALINELDKLRDNVVAAETRPENEQCDVSGSWLSEASGVVFNLRPLNELIQVDVYPATVEDYAILNINWTLTGTTPFGMNGTLILTAQDKENQHVAVFVGHCRICDGSENIIGQWLVNYGTNDCRHFIISQATLGDVFRRTVLPPNMK